MPIGDRAGGAVSSVKDTDFLVFGLLGFFGSVSLCSLSSPLAPALFSDSVPSVVEGVCFFKIERREELDEGDGLGGGSVEVVVVDSTESVEPGVLGSPGVALSGCTSGCGSGVAAGGSPGGVSSTLGASVDVVSGNGVAELVL